MTEFPACTLGPAALNDRIEEIRAIGPGSQAFHTAFTGG